MHPDFETLATLLPLAVSSHVRKPEIKNSIWNASLEIGKWSGKRNEYRHGTYRPPYRRAVILKAKKANLSAKEKEEGRGVMDCIYILMNAIHAPSPLTT